MRVLQIFNRYLNAGGEENSVNRIALQLKDGGAEVERFIRSAEEWKSESAPPVWRQVLLLSNNSALLEELREQHLRFQPDVWLLHNVLPVISLGVYRLAKELNVPIVQWLHNYRPLSLSGSLRLRGEQLTTTSPLIHAREILQGTWRGRASTAVLAAGYARARMSGWFDHVAVWVAVSETMMKSFARADFYPDKLHFLRHSWEIQPSLRLEAEEKTFLYLGRLLPEKGVGFLLKLFQDERLADCKLLIAGDGPMHSDVECVNASNIEFLGWISGEEKKELINRATAVLFPSLWEEPLSTIAYEAYEQERALVTSDRGGMIEIVGDRETGLVLAAEDTDCWIYSLRELAGDKELVARLGRQGRQWLEENVSGEIWYDGFLQIVEKACVSVRGEIPSG